MTRQKCCVINAGMKTRQWDGGQLRNARHRRGWSQDQLAREVPTSVTNISRWERDKHGPRADFIPALASALGVEEGSFFQANGAEPDAEDEEESDLAAALRSFVRAELARQQEQAA